MDARRGWAALAALGLIACEPVDFGPRPDGSAGDTGETGSTGTSSPLNATQVGSEGLWGCPIDGLDPLGPREDVAGFGVAEDVLSGLVRAFALQFPAEPSAGALALGADAYFLQRSSTCGDALVASASGTAERGTGPLAVTARVGTDGARSVLAAAFVDAPADVAAAWALPEVPAETVAIRMVLAPDGSGGLTGDVSFAPCGAEDVDCPTRTTAVALTAQ